MLKRVKIAVTLIVLCVILLIYGGIKAQNNSQKKYSFDTLWCKKTIDFALEVAADDELRMRITATDPQSFYQFIPDVQELFDTVMYITRTVVSLDTVYKVHYHKFDLHSVLEFFQYIYKYRKPINPSSFEYFFTKCLQANGILTKKCHIQLIDLKNNTVTGQNNDIKPTNCIESDVYPLDLEKTIAVKAYVEISTLSYHSDNFVISSSK